MAVNGLDHVNIRTTDVATFAQFYVDLFDFEFRQGPLVMGHQSNWLVDANGRAIIHLRVLEADSVSTGPIDHVALSCRGKAQILERLKSRHIEFGMVEGLLPGVTQVMVKDPHGVTLELNFADE
jgi:catechol 2,3-dioxygenase-like lactoylglutathione lyase family enzyme